MTNESTQDQGLKQNPIVTLEMENGNTIKIELYPEVAPQTVKNFVSLVTEGFFDGLIFHRVIPGFMIQGGDPNGTGMGGSKQTIPGEFSANGFKNDLRHDRGVISMARTSAPNSASSQFFIVVKASTHLDGQYASFGKVIEGMEEVDRIVSVQKDRSDKPLEDQRMKKVTIQL
ncbi:peptidylprolyl isomerase [Desulfosporosinus sp. BG]|uniref:peptidylprolyl isomerase n=1 Tax=Desulfosporosinus sp. BG TaxID=1633135 RepID=UPI000855FD6E|nr:peptidylprolyl isomerase [Desulfosporosinus sp. BG]ODA40556.1 Peptidyl-prolyl cis-trans isomerase [Desulfosporosinus sp. BG]